MNMEKDKLEELKLLSAKIRKDVLEMLEKRGYGHMGGSLSIVVDECTLWKAASIRCKES